VASNPDNAFQVALLPSLRAAGITLQQFEQIARDSGITLRDGQRIIPGAFDALRVALAETIRGLTQFTDSLDSQRTRATLRDELARTPGATLAPGADALATINREFMLLARLAPQLAAAVR
jgi:hypothetical protein